MMRSLLAGVAVVALAACGPNVVSETSTGSGGANDDEVVCDSFSWSPPTTPCTAAREGKTCGAGDTCQSVTFTCTDGGWVTDSRDWCGGPTSTGAGGAGGGGGSGGAGGSGAGGTGSGTCATCSELLDGSPEELCVANGPPSSAEILAALDACICDGPCAEACDDSYCADSDTATEECTSCAFEACSPEVNACLNDTE